VGSCEHGNEPSGSIKCGKFLAERTLSFSRRTLLHGISFICVVLHTMLFQQLLEHDSCADN
jgi:hypothetical protein